VAAVPYRESDDKVRRKERRAPALLSEFAATMDGAPLLESTSGLSTRPVQVNRHSNSISAKRAAELQRMNEFEEENMTRLVTTKREAKRRREDEEALALGYGVGGSARGRARRQNGLEAELEGVLGARGSRGVWDNVSQSMGRRADLLERGKASQRERASDGDATRAKKARFDKDIVGRKRR
jgi:U3 small nucleolar ribonucleoprotein protein LCP5